MNQEAKRTAQEELDGNYADRKLLAECIATADGDEVHARQIYLHRRAAELTIDRDDIDQREKWPMLTPLLILYSIGTIGVLALVFCFLAGRLGWW